MFSPFTGERPQTNDQRLEEFYRRWRAARLDTLMDRVEELEQLIGLGDPERLPAYLRRQAT